MALIDPASRKALDGIFAALRADPESLGPFLADRNFRRRLNRTLQKAFRSYTNPTAAKLLFQYELEPRPEDLERVAKVIADFDAKRDLKTDFAKNWIERNGKKLFQHAVNMEYAAEIMDRYRLREKLNAIRGDVEKIDSLAWWMNRKPLPSKPVGTGTGMTARDLRLDIVAHETKDFLAYESITRSHTGEPNVFTSREGFPGEAAIYGEGFYTRIGREGARNTGFTIRFHLGPDAREGTDFSSGRPTITSSCSTATRSRSFPRASTSGRSSTSSTWRAGPISMRATAVSSRS